MRSATFVVMSYGRPSLALSLLRQIERESPGHKVDVRLYDDASPCDYSAVRQFLQERGWSYIRAAENHGKRGYWVWVTRAYQDLVSCTTDLCVRLDDDVDLCRGFLGLLFDAWDRIDDPRKASLTLLVDESRERRPCWTNSSPRRAGHVDRVGYVDSSFAFDSRMLGAIGYRVPPVDPRRWERNPSLSSGLGEGVSRLLHREEWGMYRTRNSLVRHVDGPSMMNPEARSRTPVVTLRFADEVAPPPRPSGPVRAGLASVPERESGLSRAVASLVPQVDRLDVYLNGYASVPAFLSSPKISVHRSQNHGDPGDAGKFFGAETWDGYVLTCDDDIVYPEDHAARMAAAVDRYGRGCAASLHGAVLPKGWRDYYKDRRVHHCAQAVPQDVCVHVAGTGALCYHTSALRPSVADFPVPNMADIWFALHARRRGVPLVVAAHDAGTLELIRFGSTIYDRAYRGKEGRRQSEALATEPWWRLPAAADLRKVGTSV